MVFNNRDVFSHSAECDQIFSILSPIIGGVPHVKCHCWCHSAQSLYGTPEPEYDLTPPPEYQGSFDAPFLLDEPEHVRVGFTNSALYGPGKPETVGGDNTPTGNAETSTSSKGAVVLDSRLNEIEARLAAGDFPGRSPLELTTGKCDTCGDKLADCECVE